MLKRDKKRGQVILETALVLISIAALAISSAALFSNLNRNMLMRLDEYRDSRRNAVNDAVTVPSEAFLDYSPWIDIISRGVEQGDIDIPGTGGFGDFGGLFYEDPRIERAQELFEEYDKILSDYLPVYANEAYYDYLGGVDCDDWYNFDCDFNPVTRSSLETAKELVDLMIQDRSNYQDYVTDPWGSPRDIFTAPRAYDDFYEDYGGVDVDSDFHIGGVGLYQQVLDVPLEDGPFDPDLGCAPGDDGCIRNQDQNMVNRDIIQSTIDTLMDTKDSIDCFFDGSTCEVTTIGGGGIMGNLTTARDHIGGAIAYCCSGGEYNTHLKEARRHLYFVVSQLGILGDIDLSGTVSALIIETYELLEPEVTFGELDQARNNVYAMLAHEEIVGNPPFDRNGEPPYQDTLYQILLDVENCLNQAIASYPSTIADEWMDSARDKLGVLYDVVTFEE